MQLPVRSQFHTAKNTAFLCWVQSVMANVLFYTERDRSDFPVKCMTGLSALTKGIFYVAVQYCLAVRLLSATRDTIMSTEDTFGYISSKMDRFGQNLAQRLEWS